MASNVAAAVRKMATKVIALRTLAGAVKPGEASSAVRAGFGVRVRISICFGALTG